MLPAAASLDLERKLQRIATRGGKHLLAYLYYQDQYRLGGRVPRHLLFFAFCVKTCILT